MCSDLTKLKAIEPKQKNQTQILVCISMTILLRGSSSQDNYAPHRILLFILD